MKDHVVRAVSDGGKILGLACVTTQLVQEACRIHEATVNCEFCRGSYPFDRRALEELLAEMQNEG